MRSLALARTHAATLPSPPDDPPTHDRRRFWAAYLQWLSVATTDELDQLQQLLAEHSLQVRPLTAVIAELLSHRPSALRVPPTLLATFVGCGWRPDPGSRWAARCGASADPGLHENRRSHPS
jgi:hypothetical protein